jgi:ribosomal protein L7/L12
MTEEELDRIKGEIFAGRKIGAIKLYRESTGEGLKEAKDAVELLESELRRAEPEKFNAPPAAKGCAMLVLAVFGAIGLIVEIVS